jgi:hypothetical protein
MTPAHDPAVRSGRTSHAHGVPGLPAGHPGPRPENDRRRARTGFPVKIFGPNGP